MQKILTFNTIILLSRSTSHWVDDSEYEPANYSVFAFHSFSNLILSKEGFIIVCEIFFKIFKVRKEYRITIEMFVILSN